MQLKLAHLLLIFDVPDAVLGVDAGADNVSVINNLDFIDHRVQLNVHFHYLIFLCVEQQEQSV